MSSSAWTYLGWTVLAGGLVLLQVTAVATGRWPTLADLIRAVTRRRAVQWSCLAGWLWLGWHVLVRSSR